MRLIELLRTKGFNAKSMFVCLMGRYNLNINWPSSQENLSSGFPTKGASNQSPQLQRLDRNWNFNGSKFSYDTFQNAKGADQSAQMHRLVCACVVRKPQKTAYRVAAQFIHVSYHNQCKLSVKRLQNASTMHGQYCLTWEKRIQSV